MGGITPHLYTYNTSYFLVVLSRELTVIRLHWILNTVQVAQADTLGFSPHYVVDCAGLILTREMASRVPRA